MPDQSRIDTLRTLELAPRGLFIDGRFRVACCALVAKYMRPDAVVAIHDYRHRKHYHAVETLMRPIAEAGEMTLFVRRRDVTVRDAERLFETMKLDAH